MEQTNRKPVFLYIVIVALVIALVVAFARISELSDEIQNVRSLYQNRLQQLQNEIDSIYDNVDEQMKQEASLLAGVEYSCGELDVVTHEVPVTLTVTPKVIAEDMTLAVTIGDKTMELLRKGSVFTTVIPTSLFLEYEKSPLLTMRSGGTTQTEYLESVAISNLWSEYLPSGWSSFSADTEEYSDGKLSLSGTLHMAWYDNVEGEVVFDSFILVTERAGKEVIRENITAKMEGGKIADKEYMIDLQIKQRVDEDERFAIYLLAEDSLGYIHKERVFSWYMTEGGYAEEVDMGYWIYDDEGNLLYDGKN